MVQFSISQRTQTRKKCSMFTSKLCFMEKSACYIAVRGIKGDDLGGHMVCLKEKKIGKGRMGGERGRWSRGRIGKVHAHRFEKDPDVYCYICRAAFVKYLASNRVNKPTSPPPKTRLRRTQKCFYLLKCLLL